MSECETEAIKTAQKFTEEFFKNYTPEDSFKCMQLLRKKFGLSLNDAYAVVSHHLSKKWIGKEEN